MKFKVVSTVSSPRPASAFLVLDSWDDWFTYNTTYSLVYVDENSNRINIGTVKIGAFNMPADQNRPDLPKTFDGNIGERFFSLGQDDNYYDRLNGLGSDIRDEVLIALNDVAKNEEIFSKAIVEKVTRRSLLRFVTPATVRGQFRRLANGGARLSTYQFKYNAPRNSKASLAPVAISFKVKPESNPPTNIHVIIGRNGVGKTHLLNNMINSLLEPNTSKFGKFSSVEITPGHGLFANLVSVTFSAFDESEPPAERRGKTEDIQYSYVGLKRVKKGTDADLAPKSPVMLTNEFAKSVLACRAAIKLSSWRKALTMLETDPIFKEAEIAKIAEDVEEEQFKESATNLFKKLSSGHKIVLLTITRLVETVAERSLVLLDEPEAHLHPPLLSAFIRALSDLLIYRNGVAIIATHSPVVLQEVPKSCIWKLRRTGAEVTAERLETESFGENVGSLTREIFGLEVTHSGFHSLLIQAVNRENDFDAIVSSFEDELGTEAKAIVRTLLHLKNNQNQA